MRMLKTNELGFVSGGRGGGGAGGAGGDRGQGTSTSNSQRAHPESNLGANNA